jgi:hypothetical protein
MLNYKNCLDQIKRLFSKCIEAITPSQMQNAS